MTDTNQKLREALQALLASGGVIAEATDAELMAAIDDPKAEHIVKVQASAVLNARQALALPTADHIPDAGEKVADHLPNAGKMINGLTQSETDASASVSGLTAASVGERDAFEHDLSKSPFEFDMDRWPDNAPVDWPGSYKQYHVQCAWDAWQARAALSAGDAEDAQLYRLVRRGQHFSVINGIGDTLRGEALDAAAAAAMRARGESVGCNLPPTESEAAP